MFWTRCRYDWSSRMHFCACLWGGPRVKFCQILSYSVDGVVLILLNLLNVAVLYWSIDGVVLGLVCLLDVTMLKSISFLGMMPCIDDDQGLACGFSCSFLFLEYLPIIYWFYGQ